MLSSSSRVAERYLAAGMFKGPPAITERLTKWALTMYAEDVLASTAKDVRTTNPEFLDMGAIRDLVRACQAYASKPVRHAPRVKIKVPVDLSGWAYLEGPPPFQTINAELWIKSGRAEHGWWRENTRTLILKAFPAKPITASEFLAGVEDLRKTVRHEVQHVGQSLTQEGVPSREYPAPQDEHDLLDREFYPVLQDTIEEFRKRTSDAPVESLPGLIRDFVGAGDGPHILSESPFFRVLRKRAPARWQHAIAEITTEVLG